MSKLNNLNAWMGAAGRFFAPKSAQGYLTLAMAVSSACGTACGAGDDKPKEPEKPSACGTSCGAGDK